MHFLTALILSSFLLLLLSTNRYSAMSFVFAPTSVELEEEEFGGMAKDGVVVCPGNMSGHRCSEMAVEEEMDSEVNKRILLMQKKFISYDTLKRDMVPCNTPGASYYNCRGTGPANSYSRGCEMITRCDRGG